MKYFGELHDGGFARLERVLGGLESGLVSCGTGNYASLEVGVEDRGAGVSFVRGAGHKGSSDITNVSTEGLDL